MKKINLLLIGYPFLKNYFSSKFNVIVPKFKKKYYITEICKDHKIDVILQIENLSKREIIYDLSGQNCLKIFWAIDIHLNFYWQTYYFRNFDIILSSQKNFINQYKDRKIYWVPWGIPDENVAKNFKPFKERKYQISFVGLIDENRLKRKIIIEELQNNFEINLVGTTLKDRLPFEKMLEIYRNSWIVVNESINKEINFRYFEVTSQGALLYSEKINNGEELLFRDKEEVLYFSQFNLIQRLKYFLNYHERLEKIAYDGWKKTLKFHKLSDRIKMVEKIIIENLNNFSKRESSIDHPLFFTYLRAIGEPFYKDDFLKLAKNKVLLTLFMKCIDEKLFLKLSEKIKDNYLIKLNLIVKDYEIILNFIKKNLKKIPEYYIGFLNLLCRNRNFF